MGRKIYNIDATAKMVEAYNDGQSLGVIAKNFHTYPTSVKRILEREGVELRHDVKRIGTCHVQDGEKLIEWAKAQDGLVSKTDLAAVLGKTKLSHSYFKKYPELSQYIKPDAQNSLQEYYTKLYDWLNKNNIPYKPNDRTKLQVSLDALLLGEYSGIAIQIIERPRCVSNKTHEEKMQAKIDRATKVGMAIIFLSRKHFENLDEIKPLLDSLKK